MYDTCGQHDDMMIRAKVVRALVLGTQSIARQYQSVWEDSVPRLLGGLT